MPAVKQRINHVTKELWVKAHTIMEVTGWDKEYMRRAREYGWITWKKENGFFYDYNSIPQQLIKKTA